MRNLEMQAQMTVRRPLSLPWFALLLIAVALLLGGSLGYVIKPAAVVTGPARVVIVHDGEATGYQAPSDSNQCVWINHVKSC